MIEELSPKRCEGYNRVPLKFLVDGKQVILDFVTKLMRKVINQGQVPEQWKIAKVRPLHKKGPKKNIANYRPISNLSSITKNFERLVLERINEIQRREGCDLTGKSQHGFKKDHSTETACLELQSLIASHCDEGKYVTVCSLDLTAAFDLVDVGLLLKHLKIMGLPTQLIRVIADWLTDRHFYCEMNGRCSMVKLVEHGTVQGSILGPLLFALFISPLEDLVRLLVTFADDNYNIGIAKNEVDSVADCIRQTSIMVEWLTSSGLRINTSKTEVCVFAKNICAEHSVVLADLIIPIEKQLKVLGVIFDSKMTWFAQVEKAVQSANKAKQGLRLIARYFTQSEMLKLATAFFYSRLYYGSKVWLISTLTARLKKVLWQSSARMLRIVDKDYVGIKSFMSLHIKYRRATPEMWGNYSTACALKHVMSTQTPDSIVNNLTLNVLNNERRLGMICTRSNVCKIGFNCLSNRLQYVTNRMKVNWMDMSKTSFRRFAKGLFINDVLLAA